MQRRHLLPICTFVLLQALASAAWPGGTSIVRDGTLDVSSRNVTLAPTGTSTSIPTIPRPDAPLFPLRNAATFNNTYAIPESYGFRSGGNVFQSFTTFNVGTGDAAVFTVNALTNNVVARVTGGTVSTIAGLLKLDLQGNGGAGNLFLVNPSGIMMTATAAFDVPGSLHLSTADYLRFPDGRFYADPAKASTLSAADPAAFGFLGATRAPVTTVNATQACFPDVPGCTRPVCVGTQCLISPGSISLTGGDIALGVALTSLGSIRVAAVGQDMVEVPLTGPLPTVHGVFSASGTLQSLSATSGSEVSVSAGDITLTHAPVSATSADIKFNAAGNMTFDGTLTAGIQGSFSGIQANAPSAAGTAGNVNVTAGGTISLLHGGSISAQTNSDIQSGDVRVRAANIFMDGSLYDKTGIYSESGGLGSASTRVGGTGLIDVNVTGNITLTNGSQLSNSTNSRGSSGNIVVHAQNFSADGSNPAPTLLRDYVGINSVSKFGSSGNANAGNVLVNIDNTLSLTHGARISSTTYSGGGVAGNVTVNAGTVVVDGAFTASAANIAAWTSSKRYDGSASSIQAAARTGSSGQTGNVTINATNQIIFSNGGEASIQNNATLAAPALAAIVPTTLTVSAPNITLKDATITAASTGNVPASNIKINFTNLLSVDPSIISTASNLGNAGAISIIGGGGTLFLDHSQITTSVSGLTGNGGDISIQANALVMNTGFIQANTAAALAAGGNVSIGVNSLIASGNSLLVGGSTPYTPQPSVFGFNVIQAASPTGVSGDIKLASPAIDITRSLTGLTAKTVDTGGLGRSPCRITGGSSMAQAGRGGFAPSATDLLGPGTTAASPSAAGPAPALVAISAPADDSPAGKCL